MKVTYIDHMGTDLSGVNAARVSFGKKSKWEVEYDSDLNPIKRLSKADQGLIQFLARGCTSGDWEELTEKFLENVHVVDGEWVEWFDTQEREDFLNYIRKMPDHWTPFGHTSITLHIKAPIFVARQLGKHQVGFVWNEVSRRYVTDEPEFFIPEAWRKASENVKQGSSEEEVKEMWMGDYGESYKDEVGAIYSAYLENVYMLYDSMLKSGVCAEQARMVLPQSMYTEWYWTGNLYGFANVYNQRTDSHTQKETRDVAHQIGSIIEPLYPHSWSCLTK